MREMFGILEKMYNILICFFLIQKINCSYLSQPKITKDNENFLIESANDRNISIRLNGPGLFLINNFDLLNSIQLRQDQVNINSEVQFGSDGGKLSLKSHVDSLKLGLEHLNTRLQAVENRISVLPNRRARNLKSRIMRLVGRIEDFRQRLLQKFCKSDPCKNGGICIDLLENFHCDCPASWSGRTCEIDIDECQLFSGTDLGCQNGAFCVNLPGSYRCVCQNGFVGIRCTERTVRCSQDKVMNEMCGNGVCVPSNNQAGYSCICNQGWKISNLTQACTTDVNECNETYHPCHSNCINLPGSFTCAPCPNGYSGDGKTCIDIDECLSNNGGCSTEPKVQCINTEGSVRCGHCPPGWFGDGKTCSRDNTNSCQNQNICHSRARCQYISDTIICVCPPDMVGNGYGPNGCLPKPELSCSELCLNGGTCVKNPIFGDTCICPNGYQLPHCTPRDLCSVNPCLNGGTCVPRPIIGGSSVCLCPPGYIGTLCERRRGQCGSVLREPSGVLTYPANGTYHSRERCAWLLRTNDDKIFNITFTKFDLESYPECSRDFLQIHDGQSSASQLIGRFCGKEFPRGGNILSSGNRFYLWFHSDNSSEFGGFELKWNTIDPPFGGHINATVKTHGVITSPGYPGTTPPNRDYQWTITAIEGQRILFRFYEVNLDDTSINCNKDTLKIVDGGDTLEEICKTSIPVPIHTTSNIAVIHYHTDKDHYDSSFQLHYEVVEGLPDCGGVFTQNNGIIQSPSTDIGLGPTNHSCLYKIQQLPGTKINIEFNLFNLADCDHNSLEIYDGQTMDDPLIGRWCLQNKPKNITSTSNFLLLRYNFENQNSLLPTFRATYKQSCGDVYTMDNGTITSPNYPNPYYRSLSCEYIVYAPIHHVIRLNIDDIELSKFDNDNECTKNDADYLQIGTSRFCGNKVDRLENVIYNGNKAIVKFNSNGNPEKRRGFKLSYSFINIICGGVLDAPNGTISITGEDQSFLTLCNWVIEAPLGYAISLKFDIFSDFLNCADDNYGVKIITKNINDAIEYGPYCGKNPPPALTYDTNELIITFNRKRSFPSNAKFSAHYDFVEQIVNKSSCGGNLTSMYGNIQTPKLSQHFGTNVDCIWVLHAPSGHQIELRLINSTTGNNDEYLEIRNGMTANSPLIGIFLGNNMPPRIPSFTNHLYLHYHADALSSLSAFNLEWEQTATGCGGDLNSYRGSIHSPHYPEIIKGPIYCEWRIVVNQGSTININISHDLSTVRNFCSSGFLTIFDGINVKAKQLQLDCEKIDGSIRVNSTGNSVLVRYIADDVDNDINRFVLDYETNCFNKLSVLQGVIESPNFPNNYPNNLKCQWEIQSEKSDTISLKFSHLETEIYLNKCSYDQIEIIDLKDNNQIQLLEICKNSPKIFTSIGNKVIIKFSTDFSTEKKGFRLEFKRNGCNGNYNINNNVIDLKSPNSPYSTDIKCEWFFQTTPGKIISITIQDFHIESDVDDCTLNSLIISDHKNSSLRYFEECRRDEFNIMTIKSNGPTMYVQFTTDAIRKQKYFQAQVNAGLAKCGGVIVTNAKQGILTSPNYPNNYSSNLFCEWSINVQSSYYLSYSINGNIENSTNCTKDYLELTNNKDLNSVKLCGNISEEYNGFQVNQINVTLKTDNNTELNGFRLTYKRKCETVINVINDGYLNSNILDENCAWFLHVSNPKHITMNILNLECSCDGLNATRCENEKGIKIYNGLLDPKHSPKWSFCKEHPGEIISNSEHLLIIARNVSFKASYSAYDNKCGGIFQSLKGKFSSPLYPESYPVNIECIWEIQANAGNFIELQFLEMSIIKSYECNEAYLEVRENNETGKLLGLFCDKLLPDNLIAFEKLWIKFRSYNALVSKGFLAKWSYTHENLITGNGGDILSPPIRNSREESEPFTWRILVSRPYVIQLTFIEYNDGLMLFNGYDTEAMKVEIQHSPSEFISSSNVVYLVSENKLLDKFVIKWKKTEVGNIPNKVANSNCTEIIYLSNNNTTLLTSPGYPENYPSDITCEWIIKPIDPARRAVVFVKDIRLENDKDCISDSLKIFSSKNQQNWSLKKILCYVDKENKKNRAVRFFGNSNLKLIFNSDRTISGAGFSAELSTLCGGYLTKPIGYINETSIGREKNCSWTIEIGRGKQIEIDFEFSLIPDSRTNRNVVCENYFIIRDGLDENAPIMPPGRICSKNQLNSTIITNSNYAYIRYIKTNIFSLHLNNFHKLIYKEYNSCGGDVYLTNYQNSTILTSPNYPNVPNAHTECNWIIIAPSGKSIKIQFVGRFDLNAQKCSKEYVEIFDGSTDLSPSLGKFCRNPLKEIRSSGNILYFKYFTDIPEPRNGFKSIISISQCGGFYYDSEGIITSENYPILGGYPSRTICNYEIKSFLFSRRKITFQDIHLPYDQNNLNNSDYIQIIGIDPNENGNPVETILDTIYGNRTEMPFYEFEQIKCLIRFITHKPTTLYRGFKLSYQRTPGGCNRHLTDESGEIVMKRNLQRVLYLTCQYRITVPKGQQVQIEFLEFIPPDHHLLSIGVYNDFEQRSRIELFKDDNYDFNRSISSTDNIMSISIFGGFTSNIELIRIKYKSENKSNCPNDINADTGIISSDYLNKNLNYYCRSVFTLNETETIAFSIHEFEIIKQLSEFGYGILQFRNKVQVYVNYQQNLTNEIIVIPFKIGSIQFQQTANVKIQKLQISYKKHKCGGSYLTNNEYLIQQPNMTIDYGQLDCGWQIYLKNNRNGFIINAYVNLSLNCNDEYIKIFTGSSPNSPVLKTFCGNVQIDLNTTASQYYVVYHTKNYNKNSKFNLNWKAANNCGGQLPKSISFLHNSKFTFNSNDYKNNLECIWNFESELGLGWSINFIGRFFIETSPNCTKDYLEIQKYINNDWMSFQKYCGRSLPSNINTTDSKLRMIFRSDNEITGDGFQIEYKQTCGGIYNVSNLPQVIEYPYGWENGVFQIECNYTLVTDTDNFINVVFDEFDLNNMNNCKDSRMTVYMPNELQEPIENGVYCKANSLNQLRSRYFITLKYFAIAATAGFRFRYQIDDCIASIQNDTEIYSPKDSNTNEYPNNMECLWNITAPSDQNIFIQFKYFELEMNLMCTYDYVVIYSGYDFSDENRKSLMCGNLTMKNTRIHIDNNRALIVASSDRFITARGFAAKINFVKNCDINMNITIDQSQHFEINLNESFDEMAFCNYRLFAPNGYRVELQINNIIYKNNNKNISCLLNGDICTNCHSLHILDNDIIPSQTLGSFCGFLAPQTFVSSKNHILIQTETPQFIQQTISIKLIATAKKILCGNEYIELGENETRTLKFPLNNGTKYEPNIFCMWRISSTKSFTIYINKIDLEEPSQLNGECFDYLQIKQVLSKSKHVYCGNSSGYSQFVSLLHTTMNMSWVEVTFKSNEINEYSGFELILKPSNQCHETFNRLNGRIKVVSRNSLCGYDVVVPNNYSIAFYFQTLYGLGNDCNSEYMKFYNKKTDQLLQTICGRSVDPIFTNISQVRIEISSKIWGLIDMTYIASENQIGCGGKIFEMSGTFTSPLYPNNDKNNMNCRWEIQTSQNHLFSLEFVEFDLGAKVNCASNFLQIIEILPNGRENVVRQFCGDDKPQTFRSNGNMLAIVYKKTINFDGGGWKLNFYSIDNNDNGMLL